MTALLALDVGNSAVRVARMQGERVLDRARFLHSDPGALDGLAAFCAAAPAATIALVSVHAAAATKIADRLAPRAALRTPGDFAPGVVNDCVPPEKVGADRLFDAAGVPDAGGTYVVVDAGTAVTVDLVVAGTFRGGAILAGARLAAEALHRHTAQLPEIDVAALAGKTIAAVGRNTADALASGVVLGLAGAVDRLVAAVGRGYDARVLLTGGDAPLLMPQLACAPTPDPDLMFRGIARAVGRGARGA